MTLPVRHRSRRARLRSRITAVAAGLLLPLAGLAAATPPASAAPGLTQVTGFGSNPGSLNMYSYRPAGVPDGGPLVVALHGCTQSANDYYTHSGWPKYADLYGFTLVFPEQPSVSSPISNCFDWGTPSDDGRDQGEAESVHQMIEYAESTYHVDPARIYVTGLSAGGGMTADLLADYPDVFAAGSIDSGPAAQCSTTGIFNTNCTSGTTSRTVQQWGDLIRGSHPGYGGPWPRVAVWQGSSDTTVNPAEMTYSMDGWTNVRGIGQTPSSTQSLPGGTTERIYADGDGTPAVVTFSVSGMPHGLAVHPGSGTDQCGTTGTYYPDAICSSYYTAHFFGLDGTTGTGQPAPAGLKVTGTTADSATLTWNSVPDAAGYAVYRDGTKVTASAVTGTTYTDTGLSSGTAYTYTVAAVDSSGRAGTPSPGVVATTTGAPAGQCFTDTNYGQVAAGRAHQTMGTTYANGSNQNMGLYNVFVRHTLRETSPGYYVVADGQC